MYVNIIETALKDKSLADMSQVTPKSAWWNTGGRRQRTSKSTGLHQMRKTGLHSLSLRGYLLSTTVMMNIDYPAGDFQEVRVNLP